MTSVKERVRKAIFGRLKSLQRKLHAQGIPCTYSPSVLTHEGGNMSFTITYRPSGNGDTTVLPQLSIRTSENVEEFDSTNFEHGLARVNELFHAQNGSTAKAGMFATQDRPDE